MKVVVEFMLINGLVAHSDHCPPWVDTIGIPHRR